jgi:hypoxanthine phosphoribosyltransferase
LKILIEKNKIDDTVKKLGGMISRDYADKNPVMVGVLKGAFMFMADLLRSIDIPCEVDFLSIQSYNGRSSSGVVRLLSDLTVNITGRHVILVEDVIDTGRTVSYILENLKTRKPDSLVVCTLLDKQETRQVDIGLEYVGFRIPDVFVVGYGLDYENNYRHLDYIGVLDGSESTA